MSKNPAVLFYPSDFLAGTMLMTNEEVGAYIKLLCLQRDRGHLPREVIDQVCDHPMPKVLEKFDVDARGLYYNARMEEEIIKRDNFCESRRESVQARYVCNTYVERMGNGNRNNISNSNNINNSLGRGTNKYLGEDAQNAQNAHPDAQSDAQKCAEKPPDAQKNAQKNAQKRPDNMQKCAENAQMRTRFAEFWIAYPRKNDKRRAEATFMKLAPDAELMAQMIAAIERQKKSDQWLRDNGRYIPYPTTWLNGRRWEDEIPDTTKPRLATFDINDAFDKAIKRTYEREGK